MKKILRQFTKNCILMAEVTSFKGIFEYMYIKNAEVFFIKGILMMILTFRDELSTRIRIWIRDFYFRSDPDPGKNFPDPKPWSNVLIHITVIADIGGRC